MLERHIEALIFASEHPIPRADVKICLQDSLQMGISDTDLQAAIDALFQQYRSDRYAFELVEISNGYQFLTKPAYHATVATHLKQTTKKKLSTAALETLSIIAYKQPTTKTQVEEIRGVNCDYAVQKLLEKELITIAGRSDGPGRPLLYATSEKFMNYFGLKNLKDLPNPKDFQEIENTIGEMPN